MMFIRLKALYHGQRVILGLVFLVGLASFVTNAYLLTGRVTAVMHNPASGVRGTSLYRFCIPDDIDDLKACNVVYLCVPSIFPTEQC